LPETVERPAWRLISAAAGKCPTGEIQIQDLTLNLFLSSFEIFVLSFSAPGIKAAGNRFKQLEGTIETTIVKKLTVGGVS
jgi:hypothetical protein